MRRPMALVTLLCCAAAGAARAQVAHEHRGFWWSFGLGGGNNTGTGFDGQTLPGGAFYVTLGGTPSQKVLLGWEAQGWFRGNNARWLSRGNSVGVVRFYPSRQGFYLKGGAGISIAQEQTTAGNTTTTTTETGFGVTFGTGFDVKLGRNIYLVPAFDILLQAFEERTDPILGDIPATNSIVLFTVGLLWH